MSNFLCRKNKIQILSVIISLVVLITTAPMQAFAATVTDNNKDSGKISLNKTFQFYKNFGENTNIIYQSDERLIYDVNIPIDGYVITSHIDARIDERGNQIINIVEGEKEDTLLYTSDGKLYENGNLVTDAVENRAYQAAESQEIMPMGGHRIYYQDSAPYGKNSDYTKSSGTVKKVLSLSKAIKSYTVAALATVIVGVLFSGGLGIAAGLITAGVQAIISYFKRNEPSSKAMSLKDTVTVHKTKGFNVTSSMSTDKHKITYYHNENYTGAISGGTSTLWRVFAY